MENSEVREALEEVRAEHNGVLKPEAVVKTAREEDSPLHRYFEWDDSEAARKHRLHQARQLIRVCVTIEPRTKREVRAFVSFADERTTGGGYHSMLESLADTDKRRRVLNTAIMELKAFQKKYDTLKELEPVFEAMEEVERAVA